jgi:hypothetical protein
MRDAKPVGTMKNISKMMTKKNLDNLLKGVIAAVTSGAAIPYIMRPRKAPIAAYVIGGVSFAIAGGLAALFFFSPKTRNKALSAAKDSYAKVSDTISHLRPVNGLAHADGDASNGFSGHAGL